MQLEIGGSREILLMIQLAGDSSKAQNILGWKTNIYFHELIKMMVDADLNCLHSSGIKELLHLG